MPSCPLSCLTQAKKLWRKNYEMFPKRLEKAKEQLAESELWKLRQHFKNMVESRKAIDLHSQKVNLNQQ